MLCDCNMFWLWDAINPSNYSERIYRFELSATCAYPVALNHKRFSELQKTDFNCGKISVFEPELLEFANSVMISRRADDSCFTEGRGC